MQNFILRKGGFYARKFTEFKIKKTDNERGIVMKKFLTLLCAGIMCLSLYSCGGGAESAKDISTEAEAVGRYKSAGLFLKYECTLNENTTFDIVGNNYQGGTKGTYFIKSKNEIELNPKNSAADIWRKKGKYYYSTDSNYLTKVFKQDTEYELKPTFDKNGRSNQNFKAGEQDQFNYVENFVLSLNEDGTYSAKHTIMNKPTLSYDLEEAFDGTYKFENDILWLNFEDNEYPLLLINDKLFFDVLEKTE